MNDENFALEVSKAAVEAVVKESTNRIANAVGSVLPFFGIKHEAVKSYIEEIKNSTMSPEAKLLAIANTKRTYKELINQSKIARIAETSAKEGTDFGETSEVDDDWLSRFMDSAKFVSNEEMQYVWGRILAGEFEVPGSTPPQMIRLLSEITPLYARVFVNLCNLISRVLVVNEGRFNATEIIIVDVEDEFFRPLTINFTTLNELQNYGLIEFSSPSGFINKYPKELIPKLHIAYDNKVVTVTDYPDKKFPIGEVLLTDVGRCLSGILVKNVVEGYFECIIKYLTKKNVSISEKQEIEIVDNNNIRLLQQDTENE